MRYVEVEVEIVDLNKLISYLEYGTNIHISVVFLRDFGNFKMELPFDRVIHSKPYCQKMKSTPYGFKRCFACRNLAIKKAVQIKESFGGKCINNVYEYVSPVVINTETVAVIFIGNIFSDEIYESPDTFEKDFCEEKCKELSEIIKNHILLLDREYKNIKTSYNPLIVNVLNYLDESLLNDVTVSQISKEFNYSEKYMGRIFKKEVGETIKEYVNRKRIEKAEKMIIETNLSIVDVSLMCGFNNVTYFNKLFKKRFNASPIEYRNTKNAKRLGSLFDT